MRRGRTDSRVPGPFPTRPRVLTANGPVGKLAETADKGAWSYANPGGLPCKVGPTGLELSEFPPSLPEVAVPVVAEFRHDLMDLSTAHQKKSHSWLFFRKYGCGRWAAVPPPAAWRAVGRLMATMHLPPEAIHEFRAHWRREFGEDLSLDAARAEAERVLRTIHKLLTLRDRADARAIGSTALDGRARVGAENGTKDT